MSKKTGTLGEFQNGFRIGRRVDDILFVLTQCTEISSKHRRPLYVSFLDITGAYDNVNRNILWDILEREDIGNDCIELLREMYLENPVCAEWEGMRSEEQVDINKD